ncbi:MAG TPA: DUF72 domain-containing protein [Flavisolibacter sp.]|nr:DUF72 domain-containing protein [Flavisolibacter sp.]
MKEINWFIGCSGFHYREWKEIFYPKGLPQSKWFEFYTRSFNTIEINNTFYKFPQVGNLLNWYQKSPAEFKFTIKVPGAITHYKQFKETETLVADFYNTVHEGLKEKLGCVLFQLPPKLQYSKQKLEEILKQINIFYQNVIEFRHNSWWRKDVFEELANHNIVFCGVSYPGIISDAINNQPLSYYRFHGVPKLYYSSYDEEFLNKVANSIKNSKVTTAYIYFNNTASAAALENAAVIKNLVGLTSTISK